MDAAITDPVRRSFAGPTLAGFAADRNGE